MSSAIVSERTLFLCASKTPPDHPLKGPESDNQWKRKRKKRRQKKEKMNTFNVFLFIWGWTGLFIMTCIPPLTSLIELFRETLWPLAFRTIGTGMFPSVRKPGQQQEHEGAHGKATVYCGTGWDEASSTHTYTHTHWIIAFLYQYTIVSKTSGN